EGSEGSVVGPRRDEAEPPAARRRVAEEAGGPLPVASRDLRRLAGPRVAEVVARIPEEHIFSERPEGGTVGVRGRAKRVAWDGVLRGRWADRPAVVDEGVPEAPARLAREGAEHLRRARRESDDQELGSGR